MNAAPELAFKRNSFFEHFAARRRRKPVQVDELAVYGAKAIFIFFGAAQKVKFGRAFFNPDGLVSIAMAAWLLVGAADINAAQREINPCRRV